MNIVDSCGWLEYFADADNAQFFADAIEDVDHLIVPSICLFEVFKRILQQRGENDAIRAVAMMRQGEVIDLDSTLAMQAADQSLQYKLPMADSIILATARMHSATIWTQDSDFEGLSDVRYIKNS
jgi:predicted nucleic acid-binding protein